MPIYILNQAFGPEKTAELVDILRRNFLYQEPEQNEVEVRVRMIADHWDRMIELITEHGGWELPQEMIEALSDDSDSEIDSDT